jgi:hypothetical protein
VPAGFEHKVNAMRIALENYGAFVTHIESISESDSNPAKQAELQGYFNNGKMLQFPYTWQFTWMSFLPYVFKFGPSTRIARPS